MMKLHETLKLVTFAIVPLSALAETVTYTAGDTSLANDKITFGYDVSGDITTMRMRTDDNETLVLTGAALSFADGAHLIARQLPVQDDFSWIAGEDGDAIRAALQVNRLAEEAEHARKPGQLRRLVYAIASRGSVVQLLKGHAIRLLA